MPDREKVISDLRDLREYYAFDESELRTIDDAIELLKEQGKQKFFVDAEGKITPLPIVFPNCLLKEQEDKPVLDEFGKCFLNALKRQLDMKLTMIELLITPEFAEKIVELIEKMFD